MEAGPRVEAGRAQGARRTSCNRGEARLAEAGLRALDEDSARQADPGGARRLGEIRCARAREARLSRVADRPRAARQRGRGFPPTPCEGGDARSPTCTRSGTTHTHAAYTSR